MKQTSILLAIVIAAFSVGFGQDDKSKPDEFVANVRLLPSVDKVEIFAVKWVNTPGSRVDCTASDIICAKFPGKILASATLVGEDAVKVSELWRSLENGNGAACFAPAYVIRFSQKEKVILVADVCFHCCNITVPSSQIRSFCGNEKSAKAFEDFVTTRVPYPKS